MSSYDANWNGKTWKVDPPGGLDLIADDVLTFGSSGDRIQVDRLNVQPFGWGDGCSYVSGTEAQVDYQGTTYKLTHTSNGLTCSLSSPSFYAQSARGGFVQTAAAAAGGIGFGTVVGYLFGAPLLAALAGVAAAGLGFGVLKHFISYVFIPDAGDQGTVWTAQGGESGGSGGNLVSPRSQQPVTA